MKMFRLTVAETELLRSKSIEINKKLVAMNKEPLKESELLHRVLQEALPRIEVGKQKSISIF